MKLPVETQGPGCQLTISALSQAGEGVARDQGEVIFVPGALPGDVISPTRIEVSKGIKRAVGFALVQGSPDRVASYCDVAECGGCGLRALAYAAQLREKTALVKEALRRIAKVDVACVRDAIGDPRWRRAGGAEALGYRHRVRLHAHGHEIGYRRQKSHRPLALQACPVLVPAFAERLAKLCRYLGQAGVVFGELEAVYAEGRLVIELEADPRRDFEAMAEAVRKQHVAGTIDGALLTTPGRGRGGARARRYGETHVLLAHPACAGPPRFYLEPGVFSQANWAMNAVLIDVVAAEMPAGQTVVEWHAGAGNFTVAYADRVAAAYVTEIDARAVMCLRRNVSDARPRRDSDARLMRDSDARLMRDEEARHGRDEEARHGRDEEARHGRDEEARHGRDEEARHGRDAPALSRSGVHVFALGDVDAAARTAVWRPQTLLLDPPRTGAKTALARLLAGGVLPERIVYVSCDPASFARDVGILGERYRLASVQPVDMFAGTPHVEAVAVLVRV